MPSLSPLSALWQSSLESREKLFHQVSSRNYARLYQTWHNILIAWDISSKKKKKDNIQSMKFCHEVVFVWCPFSKLWIHYEHLDLPNEHILFWQKKRFNTEIKRFLQLEGKQKNNALHGLEILVKEEWILQSWSVTKMCFVHLRRRVSVLFEKRWCFHSLTIRTIWTFLKVMYKSF